MLPGCRLLSRSHRHAILFLNILASTYQPLGLTLDGTILLISLVYKMATLLTEMATWLHVCSEEAKQARRKQDGMIKQGMEEEEGV